MGQWLDIWLQTRHQLRAATRRLYTQQVRDYLKPALGSIVLGELTIGMVQAMFTALMRTSPARGRPLAPTTLHRVRGALTAALEAQPELEEQLVLPLLNQAARCGDEAPSHVIAQVNSLM